MEASKQKPLSDNDIESELSYAYLHAVASRAGMNCQVSNRHADNRGIDATIRGFDNPVIIDVQLKATIQPLIETYEGYYSYSFRGIAQYNQLRGRNFPPRILVVLWLTEDSEQWLHISPEELSIKKCAYWVSLFDAPETANETAETIYLPKNQLLTVESLNDMANRLTSINNHPPIYFNPKVQ